MTINDNTRNFLFRIPDRLEELENQENQSPNFYSVNGSWYRRPSELGDRIKAAESSFQSDGPDFILYSFDTFYFVVKHFKQVEPGVRQNAWVLLNRALLALRPQLVAFINENYQSDQRRELQNKLQMILYPLILMNELYEDEIANGTAAAAAATSNAEIEETVAKKKKTCGSAPDCRIYHDRKHHVAGTVAKLISLRLERLFDPAHFLNTVITVITHWVYKIIENNIAIRLRSSEFFTNLCEIITLAIDRYQHGFSMKIIELLQAKESLVSLMSEIVATILKNAPNLFLINDIIEQIKSIDINILSRDSSGPRAIASFLIELGQKCTDEMFKNLYDMFEFLEQDSYLLRNATLEVIATIIMKRFHSPTIVKEVHIKDRLLDKLEEHVLDITSYTRNRVLSLWCNLARSGAIPIDRLPVIAELICSRLKDKSCFVRKNAVHFLTLMLKENPFNIMGKKDMMLALEKTEVKRDEYKNYLYEMIKKQEVRVDQFMGQLVDTSTGGTIEDDLDKTIENDTEGDKNENNTDSSKLLSVIDQQEKQLSDMEMIQHLAQTWAILEQPFHNFWKQNAQELKSKLYHDLTFPEDLPQDDLQKGLDRFRELIIQKEFGPALVVLFSLKSIYPNEMLFQLKKSDCGEEDEDGEMSGSPAVNGTPEAATTDSPASKFLREIDGFFMSALTNFSSKFINKLSYEVTLAKLIFLAPLINFGNMNVEPEEEKEAEKQMLTQIMSQEDIVQTQQSIDRLLNTVKKLDRLANRLNLAIRVTDCISKSIPILCTLLNSRNVTDIHESINFFTYAHKMEIEDASIGVQKMLKLIFTKEKAIRDALLESFTEIYLNYLPSEEETEEEEEEVEDEENYDYDVADSHSDIDKNMRISKNNKRFHYMEMKHLSNMILKLNQGELVCAEALIKELFQAKKFNQTHLQILWERYAMKYTTVSEEDSRASLVIIGMFAAAQPSLIRNETNLSNIISISLERRCHDCRLVADTCDVLLKAFTMPQTEALERFYKLPGEHQLFQRLHAIMVDSITDVKNKYWLQMCSGIIKVIYFLAEKPDGIVANIVKECYEKIVDSATVEPATGQEDQDGMLDPISSLTTITESQETGKKWVILGKVDDVVISNFISMLGDVAINLLIHLDLHVMKELKIRQHLREKEKAAKKTIANQLDQPAKRRKHHSRFSTSSMISSADGDEEDEILGPNSNDDPFQENIAKVCEDAVLYEKGLLNRFNNLVERIAMDYHGYQFSHRLRQAASLTMAKFMVLSVRYTRVNRLTLACILEKSKDADIRSNAIISFGDLLVRFPNEIEHFTGKIFDCLMDKDFQVKSNALKVLTRLILADMIKPKGHISKIAQLIVDDDMFISSTARLFFVELGKKNNVYIYNYLPDIISNLSGENGLKESKFHEMIKFLFELLEKTRNTESLVCKLCQRFTNTSDERVWRDLSFCLAELNYNDRALFNLMNNFSLFAECLYCDQIYENISSIIANVRKAGTVKAETKNLLDELEARIEEVRTKGIDTCRETV